LSQEGKKGKKTQSVSSELVCVRVCVSVCAGVKTEGNDPQRKSSRVEKRATEEQRRLKVREHKNTAPNAAAE